jgi:hypothetical protein
MNAAARRLPDGLNPLKRLVASKVGISVETEGLTCAGGPSAREYATRADCVGGRRGGASCRC